MRVRSRNSHTATATTAVINTGIGTTSHNRPRPSARNAALNVPSVSSPLGKVMPTAIERPPVGISCTPITRNMLPSVARMSGTRSLTISQPLSRPTNAPPARLINTAGNAPQPSTTIT
ncbi:hypothetical protein D3C78_1293530 [compost metagenome]